jgi:GNAT superfamily N-acetyltransferase
LNVRVAGPDDLGTLVALRRAWAEEDAGGPIDDDGFDASFVTWVAAEATSRTFFLVEIDAVAVGMGNVKTYARMPSPGRPSDAWGYVGNVYVRPERRGDRVGSVLMEAMVSWAWEQGFDKLRLSPATRAVPFYERLGFDRSPLLQLDR